MQRARLSFRSREKLRRPAFVEPLGTNIKRGRGPSIYYVSKEVGGRVRKLSIFADSQYYLYWRRWLSGPKKVQKYADVIYRWFLGQRNIHKWLPTFFDLWYLIFEIFSDLPKGGFKSEETGGFLLLQNKYSKSLSWAENLNFWPKTVNNLFKFPAQDSYLEYLSWRSKNYPVSSDLKPPLFTYSKIGRQLWTVPITTL